MKKAKSKKRTRLPMAKGVARIDDPGRHGVGWYARVTFRGITHSKYFADASHGGTLAAFAKALAWRNTQEKKVGKPRTDRVLTAIGVRSRSGVQGVYRSRNSYVVAWTPTPGKLRREFVSITEHGPDEAFRRAVELRRKREREVYGRSVTNLEQGRPILRLPRPKPSKKGRGRSQKRSRKR